MSDVVTSTHAGQDDGNSQQQTPAWFFRFFVGYTIFTLVLMGLLYADFFRDLLAPDSSWNSVAYRLFIGLVVVPTGIVIALLILRRTHRNVIGLFLLMYAAAVMQSTLRIGSPLQVLSNLTNNSWIGLWLLPLYFPDGTVYPLRFQKWIRLHSIITSIFFVGITFFTPTVDIALGGGVIAQGANPLVLPVPQIIIDIVTTIQAVTWFSTVLLIIPSIILRFRASQGLVRQQIKVFVWAFSIFIASFIVVIIFLPPDGSVNVSQYGVFAPLVFVYQAILFPATPFAVVGYAILRHKLYDIDIIIRRTVMYTAITALLAGVYFGAVTLLQSAFTGLIGSESPLAIVISTLAIAALFTPLRRRVQTFVDRRFNRNKYDAEKTLEAFAESMRDDVDMDHLSAALVGVVEETMQPESVGLWLAQSEK